jgi:hypothetical protein
MPVVLERIRSISFSLMGGALWHRRSVVGQPGRLLARRPLDFAPRLVTGLPFSQLTRMSPRDHIKALADESWMNWRVEFIKTRKNLIA